MPKTLTAWPNWPDPRAEWTEIALAMSSRLRTCTEAKEVTLACDDGEVSVGKGRGGIEVGERHDLEERGRRGAKKARNGMRCKRVFRR
jgi:hypothetical protein